MFCSKYLNILFYISLAVQFSSCLDKGDPCAAGNEPGVCKIIDDCEYLKNLVTLEEKKPPMCFWEGKKRVVCCPLENKSHTIGVLRDYFGGTKDGVLYSQDATCRYSGNLPMLCCENTKVTPPTPEPVTCPKLALPNIRRSDIAWQKCLEYQRYVQMCVSSESDPQKYVRENACGMSTTDDRIAAGTPAGRTEFPHMALLGCRNTVNVGEKHSAIAWTSGGTLISDKFILTAAHVLSHPDYGLVTYALLGAVNKTEAREGLLFNIIRYIPHNLYVSSMKKYDIALLELDRQVQFSEFIRPACLPIPELELSQERIIAGWGTTSEDGPESDILLKAVIYEIDYETQCRRHLDAPGFTWNGETMICASADEGQIFDSCKGDSGGPLMAYAEDINCTYIIRGVVSWGPRCGKGAPGVYTNVQYYVDWIVKNVWLNK